ncbi:Aminotransferase-like, plant mobile domain [Sesbania bispinosa]|nr:Aminotransferase-like, plant mobile domain [Sesbania bispinosa]
MSGNSFGSPCPNTEKKGASSRGIETGGSVRGEPVERVRPTASARQRKRSQHVEQEDRGTLKVVTHGRKLKRPEDDYIRDIIDDSGLGPLIEGTHSMVDRSLVSAFTKRWHRGDIQFPSAGGEDAKELLVSALKVSHAEAATETEITKGAYVRLSWLRDVYKSNIESQNLNAAARAYLLHLVGCTIFADKSATAVRVAYLELFRDLRTVGKIAWGAAALAYLYEQLKDASCHNTRQLAGYTTLLQAWILEHFPHIMHIERSPDYVEGMSLCRRLRPHRPVGDVVSVRQYLDRIRHEDIIWTPYVSYRPYRPFHDICWYYDHLLDASRRGPVATHAGECIHGYLDWFRTISHPYIIPHQEIVHDPLPPTLPVYREEGTSTGTQNSTAHEIERPDRKA